MKKQFLLLIISVFTLSLNAQVFTEYFEDAPTNGLLEDYNNWYVSFKSSEQGGVSPQIVEEFLFYTDYAGSDKGKAVLLDSLIGQESATQRISTKVIDFGEGDTLRPVVGESMYAAFLVQILPNSKNSYRDFFTWEGSTGSSFTRGRIFAKVTGSDLQFAVSKNSSSDGVYVESDIYEGGVGSIFLLVLEYSSIDGDGNDVISLYVNPDPTKPAAEQTTILVSQDEQSDYSETTEIKINLRQRGVGANIGNIRVGRIWEDVLMEEVEEEVVDTTSVRSINTNNVLITSEYKTIVTDQPGVVEVYEFTGRRVLKSNTSGRLETSLKSGLFIVRFTDAENRISTRKININ
ncbi:MAG: hypothetical protein ACERKD_14475 [Prolixibacteraceae bacterium]